jgi:nitrate reductase gamma subunit
MQIRLSRTSGRNPCSCRRSPISCVACSSLVSTWGAAIVTGFAILVYRRLRVARVRATTTRSDLVLYPVLVVTIAFGMLATVWGSAVDEHLYRQTVSPWFRGIFGLDPDGTLMANAPFIFQAHAFTAWLLLAVWPFTRLVHAWSIALAYFGRAPILYRSRSPRARLETPPV